MKTESRETIWRESRGVSANHLYELAISGFADALQQRPKALDIGCGQGNFGRFLRTRCNGQIFAADGVHFPELGSESYDGFTQIDLESPSYESVGTGFDFVFMIEVIHYLENSRATVRKLAALLRPGGHLILTTVNPLALPSVAVLLRRGMYREFQDGPARYPGQRVPMLPEDGKRVVRESSLELVSLDYSKRSRLPGTAKWFQDVMPFLGGRWFSDHFRVVGRRAA